MRCPACDARNPDGAAWCGQCFTALAPAQPTAVRVAEPEQEPEQEPGQEPGRFRRAEGGLEWRCGRCAEWNPLDDPRCAVCGAPFGPAAEASGGAEPLLPVDERRLTILSAAVPGLGHVHVGRPAAGYLRMGLYAVMLVGGLVLVRAAASAGQSPLAALPLLAGALTVLVASVLEAPRLARGSDAPILTSRFTLWLIVSVLGTLMAGLLVTALTATGRTAT